MLRFCDSFAFYTTADIVARWATVQADASNNYPAIVTPGRYGSGSSALQFGGGTAGPIKYFDNLNSWIVGFAFKSSIANPTVSNLIQWFSTDNQQQVNITLVSGVLHYIGGQNGNFNYSSSTGILANTWYYIELMTKYSSSCPANSNVLQLNGVPVITIPAGTDTRGAANTANTSANQLRLGTAGQSITGQTFVVSDFYICDTTGTQCNTLLGSIRVERQLISGAGSSTQFAPSSGANWQCVSDGVEDGDATYVSSSTPGQKDTYTLTPLTTTPVTVYGIQISTVARKDDAGTRIIAPVVHSGGADYDHGTTNPIGLGDGYTIGSDIWQNDPNGNIAWTGTSVNNMNIGVKVVS